MLLDALVGVVAGLLVVAGILVMLGPQTWSFVRRLRSLRRPGLPLAGLQVSRRRDNMPPGLNPKTQRVLVSATRLSAWLRARGQDELAKELRSAAARLAADEPAGLYAMQTVLRRVRSVTLEERAAHERLQALSDDLRKAVQDRFEQLELLPFGRL